MSFQETLWPSWMPRVLGMRKRCPCCSCAEFKPAENHIVDQFYGLFLLRPVRCMFCWRRYYWFSLRAIG